MSEELTIETECADDLPVLLAQLDKMQVARLLAQHFPLGKEIFTSELLTPA